MNNIAIGYGANRYLTTESNTLCIGRDASTPKGKDYWITIKGFFDGPVPDREAWHSYHRGVMEARGDPDNRASLARHIEALVKAADMLPDNVTRDKIRELIIASI